MLYSSCKLLYFDSEACKRQRGQIELAQADEVRFGGSGIAGARDDAGFDIVTPARTYEFGCAEQAVAEEWMAALDPMVGEVLTRRRRGAERAVHI